MLRDPRDMHAGQHAIGMAWPGRTGNEEVLVLSLQAVELGHESEALHGTAVGTECRERGCSQLDDVVDSA